MYLWVLALAVTVPCAGVLIYSISSDARHDERQVRATTFSLAQLVASQIQQFLSDAESLGAKLTERPLIRSLDHHRDPIFDQFLDLHPQFANLVLSDDAGRVLQSALLPPAGHSLEDVRAEWSDAVVREGKFTVSKPIFVRARARWVCVLGCPVLNQSGEVIGALGMTVDLARFHTASTLVSLPPHSVTLIVDPTGIVISRSLNSQGYAGKDVRDSELARLALAGPAGEKIMRGLDDVERIYGFKTIPGVKWRVYVGVPTQFAFAPVRLVVWRTSLIATLVLAIIVVLVLTLGRLFSRPMRGLFEAVTAAAEGRQPTTAPTGGPREIVAVAEEFERMLAIRLQKEEEINKLNAELEQRVQERTEMLEKTNEELRREAVVRQQVENVLRAHQAELQDYIDSTTTMSAKVAPDGALLMVNKIAREAFGLPVEVLMATNFLEGQWWTFDPQVQARVRKAFASACAGTTVNYNEKLFVFGRVLDISFSLVPVFGLDEKVAYIIAEGRDITPLKQAEKALEERTFQLESANKELEAFAYSVSHDLRAPLRSIGGFSKALLEDYRDKLDDVGKDCLARVRGAVNRMAQLIDDLLKLSRFSRSEIRRSAVDLSALAGAITAELREGAPDRAVQFNIHPGLVARGDAQLLRVALENLLSNAWKFSRRQAAAHIEFGTEQVQGQTAFFVRDNGAGFDMTYSSKLFGAFQRLHSLEQYEGNGIGLATVQRIVHRHGGRVWAQGQVGQGATFYFTVPG